MTEKEVKRGQPLTTASVASRPPTASPGGRKLSDWVAEFTGIRTNDPRRAKKGNSTNKMAAVALISDETGEIRTRVVTNVTGYLLNMFYEATGGANSEALVESQRRALP